MGNQNRQISLFSTSLFCAAVPIWIFLCVALPDSPGFGGAPSRYMIPPIALTGIAFAIYRLIRNKSNSIALSVFLSPIVAYSALVIASFLSQ